MPEKIVVEVPSAPTGAAAETLVLDLGNLAAHDPSPTDTEAYREDPGGAAVRQARDVAQTLIAAVFALPVVIDTNVGPLAKLPPPSTPLPREKPLPQAKPQTKWEKFAAEKGITKKKRSKMVWDEGANEWKRRHGMDRARDDKNIAFVDAKPGDAPGSDPFAEAAKAKQERVSKNKRQQAKNMAGGEVPVAPSIALTSQLPFEGSRTGEQGRKIRSSQKQDVKTIKDVAALATASVGKFDKRLDGEKSRPKGKQRTRLPVTDSTKEKALLDTTMNRLFKKEKEGLINMEKAVRNYITDDQEERSRKKQKTAPKVKNSKSNFKAPKRK